MKRIIFIALLLIIPITASAQLVSFKKVAGPPLSTLGSDSGEYFLAQLKPEGDTVLVWMQHARRDKRPNYNAAKHADVVIWCHPDKWPTPNHVLPEKTGKIAVTRQGDTYWVIPQTSVWWKRLID